MLRIIRRLLEEFTDLSTMMLRGGAAAARRKGVKVGKNCRIYIRSFGSEPFLIAIGDNTTITSGVRLITHDGSTGLVHNADGRRYQRYAPITIGNDVFIGVNSIILPGITIGDNVVVGAGSVVTKDVPDGSVVAGNPARQLGNFADFQGAVAATCPNDAELDGISDYRARVAKAMEIADHKAAAQ